MQALTGEFNDVFIRFVGALDVGEPLFQLLPEYATSMVFFFVLHLLVTNNVVQLAAPRHWRGCCAVAAWRSLNLGPSSFRCE